MGKHSIAMSMSVSLSACSRSYLGNHIFELAEFSVHVTCGRGSVLLWKSCSMLCISSSLDDFILPVMGPMAAWRYRGSIAVMLCTG